MAAEQEVIVRRAESYDRDGLFPLARSLAQSFDLSPTTFAKSFSGLTSDPSALVLVAADARTGQLVGYLLGFRHDTFFADGPVGWVEEVHTRADRRRAGIAGALVREFESWAWANGARLVALATRRASDFYAAVGYEESASYFRKFAPE